MITRIFLQNDKILYIGTGIIIGVDQHHIVLTTNYEMHEHMVYSNDILYLEYGECQRPDIINKDNEWFTVKVTNLELLNGIAIYTCELLISKQVASLSASLKL